MGCRTPKSNAKELLGDASYFSSGKPNTKVLEGLPMRAFTCAGRPNARVRFMDKQISKEQMRFCCTGLRHADDCVSHQDHECARAIAQNNGLKRIDTHVDRSQHLSVSKTQVACKTRTTADEDDIINILANLNLPPGTPERSTACPHPGAGHSYLLHLSKAPQSDKDKHTVGCERLSNCQPGQCQPLGPAAYRPDPLPDPFCCPCLVFGPTGQAFSLELLPKLPAPWVWLPSDLQDLVESLRREIKPKQLPMHSRGSGGYP
eukprot:1142115-Amphidinium_carterae.3